MYSCSIDEPEARSQESIGGIVQAEVRIVEQTPEKNLQFQPPRRIGSISSNPGVRSRKGKAEVLEIVVAGIKVRQQHESNFIYGYVCSL